MCTHTHILYIYLYYVHIKIICEYVKYMYNIYAKVYICIIASMLKYIIYLHLYYTYIKINITQYCCNPGQKVYVKRNSYLVQE
jgi:hypothetical protein